MQGPGVGKRRALEEQRVRAEDAQLSLGALEVAGSCGGGRLGADRRGAGGGGPFPWTGVRDIEGLDFFQKMGLFAFPWPLSLSLFLPTGGVPPFASADRLVCTTLLPVECKLLGAPAFAANVLPSRPQLVSGNHVAVCVA